MMSVPVITPISKESIHKICSGQVVVTMAVAVKELLENSLDANATKIDIKFKGHGSDSIEVTDNGDGINQTNFDGITKMHCTSKLTNFEDLSAGVTSFGFRGEALSSLCQLGKVTIHTYHGHDTVGSHLTFGSHGEITRQENRPRQVGTTVTIDNLFYSLPVRRAELMRNVKREFVRTLQLITAYCLVVENVRITCFKIDAKGTKSIALSNEGGSNLKENISLVFGHQQMSSIVELEQSTSVSNDILEEYGIKPDDYQSTNIELHGWISSPNMGQGRSCADRQFLFVNNRPCDLPRVNSLVNEVYRRFNYSQTPVFVIKLKLPLDCVDVNLAPDKRTIFLAQEKHLLVLLKASLLETLEKRSSCGFAFNSLADNRLGGRQSKTDESQSSQSADQISSPTKQLNLKRFLSKASLSPQLKDEPNQKKQKNINSFFDTMSPSIGSKSKSNESPDSFTKQCKDTPIANNSTPLRFSTDSNSPDKNLFSRNSCYPESDLNRSMLDYSICFHDLNTPTSTPSIQGTPSVALGDSYCIGEPSPSVALEESYCIAFHGDPSPSTQSSTLTMDSVVIERPITEEVHIIDLYPDEVAKDDKCHSKRSVSLLSRLDHEVEQCESHYFKSNYTQTDIEDVNKSIPVSTTIGFSLKSLRSKLNASKAKSNANEDGVISYARNFRAKIDPTENKQAEEELRNVLKKSSFRDLSIVGQFNLGFILCRLDKDLFIVDQHASDEKYNFEQLEAHLTLDIQNLVCPKLLHLTVTQEQTVVDNLDVFEKNGFHFQIDENGRMGQRMKLVSIPMSKNYLFGLEDIEEMAFILSENGSRHCRPSRIRQMLASRACRKSIMIGTALNYGEMRRVLDHMSEMEQPWNCPHGRPTIRHVFSLNMLVD